MSESKNYKSIMVSSTFTDLKEHRQKAINSINKQGFHPEVMEFSGAISDKDVVDKSLAMVRDAAAYIGVISHKYGQTPKCAERNANGLSITELEFNEATRLNRPILLFIMSDEHQGKKGDFEAVRAKQKKLAAFRERAKLMKPDGKVQRIYEMFDSVDEFASKVADAIARLTTDLSSLLTQTLPANSRISTESPFPLPPELRAMPRYRKSHALVGRADQLNTLDDWCRPANQNPLLLFEAMGGSGKSLLTWHWLTEHANLVRTDWEGRFWYSFYEKGAVMADFCRQALAYMTGKSPSDFEKQPQSKLSEQLLEQLYAKPWLLVLDGLERVLVAYHRYDAAQMRDEEADSATDLMGKREPCRAIRPEDDELLAALAGAAPSKILITSRLTPLALLSKAGSPILGVLQERLPGLRPADAEAMMHACGIRGDGAAMQEYLERNCDCHPLVIGVIAGLINKNVRAPGNFDKWVAHPKGGGALNLAELDLVRARNHILAHAIDGLSDDEAHVLRLMSLFPRAADYEVLLELATANNALDQTLLDASIERLRDYGLIQYNDDSAGYDLHPVVRGVVAGRMGDDIIDSVGDALIDHFTAVPHNPWEQARTLEDVQSGIDLVATLLRLGRYEEAYDAYWGDLSRALIYNLQAKSETQQLLRPFFPSGWASNTVPLLGGDEGYLTTCAAWSFSSEDHEQTLKLHQRSIRIDIESEDIESLRTSLANFSKSHPSAAIFLRLSLLTVDISKKFLDSAHIFISKYNLYVFHIRFGNPIEAERLWVELDAMGRDWPRFLYRPGDLEYFRALDLFRYGQLNEASLAAAETLAVQGLNREVQREIHRLRGLWQLHLKNYISAVQSFDAAIQMAHERGHEDREVGVWRALALLHSGASGAVDVTHASAEQIDDLKEASAVALAELWHELGDRVRALEYAQHAHDWAVNDGEPYVRRYWLTRIRELYSKMGVEPPEVPVYDPAAHPPFDWEADVRALIEKKKAERAARKAKKRK